MKWLILLQNVFYLISCKFFNAFIHKTTLLHVMPSFSLSLLPGYSPNYANQSRYQLIKICQTFATPTWFTIALNLRSTNSTSSDHAVCQEFESEFNVYIILIHIISTLPQLNWHLTPIFVALCHDVVFVKFHSSTKIRKHKNSFYFNSHFCSILIMRRRIQLLFKNYSTYKFSGKLSL